MPPRVCIAWSAAWKAASAARYFAVLASSPHGRPASYRALASRTTSSAARSRMWASASGKAMPWFLPMGRPNTTRWLP
jgi:hypothetical protein